MSFVQPVLGLRNNKTNAERPKIAQALFSYPNHTIHSSQICLQPCIILCYARLFDSVTGIPLFFFWRFADRAASQFIYLGI